MIFSPCSFFLKRQRMMLSPTKCLPIFSSRRSSIRSLYNAASYTDGSRWIMFGILTVRIFVFASGRRRFGIKIFSGSFIGSFSFTGFIGGGLGSSSSSSSPCLSSDLSLSLLFFFFFFFFFLSFLPFPTLSSALDEKSTSEESSPPSIKDLSCSSRSLSSSAFFLAASLSSSDFSASASSSNLLFSGSSSSSSSSPQEKKSNARFQEQMHSEYQKRTTENSIGSGGGSMEYNFSTNVRKGLRRMSTAISPFVPSSPMTSSRVQPSSFETNVRILSRDFIESDIK
mmetsp:Transcript_8726/g.16205  ORF Transcript_8726/g.16205 Transcript_8726/m.16205 type:complete len:284 (+) Transcript_8726:859-1710(+)